MPPRGFRLPNNGFGRYAPVVCNGGPLAAAVGRPVVNDVKPPNSSVSPPSADKLVNAERAAGLDKSCAKGMAAAKEEAGTLVVVVVLVAEAGFVVLLDAELAELLDEARFPFVVVVDEFVRANAVDPVVEPLAAIPPLSWARLAFCSSTL